MILRWLICFRSPREAIVWQTLPFVWLLVALLFATMPIRAATVAGRVDLTNSKDRRVRKSRDFSGVVVWLDSVAGSLRSTHPVHARMVQKSKKFTPHILAIPVGATVDFPNLDPIFHNAFSNFSGQIFDIGLYPPGSSKSVRFDRAGVVRIFCNIHATMSAVIVVVDTPYFATTRPSGEYSIASVPAGVYVLHCFHERATPQTLAALERRVTVEEDEDSLAVPKLAISESDYLPFPHKNKYGKEYPPGSGEDYSPGVK